MIKKYIVRLSAEERVTLEEIVRKFKGTSEKVRRAQILLKADANGPNWTDQKIADAFSCSRRNVEIVRERLVMEGFEVVLNRKKREAAPRTKILDGKQEAQLVTMRLGSPPKGYGSWSLRLLANRMVELEIVESISHETVRRTLKKMA